jgi:hypothetical protein
MMHLTPYDQPQGALFRRVTNETCKDFPIEGASMARAESAVRAVRSALPAGWVVTSVNANHLGPRSTPRPTSRPGNHFSAYNAMRETDHTGWAGIAGDRFYRVAVKALRDIPEGSVPGHTRYARYSQKTHQMVSDMVLGMVRRGWRGTRDDIVNSEEMAELYEKLPNRRRYTWKSKYHLVDDAVQGRLADRRLATVRKGAKWVIVPGPNIDADTIPSYDLNPIFIAWVGFHQDDWVILQLYANSRYQSHFENFICDGDRGLEAALRQGVPEIVSRI